MVKIRNFVRLSFLWCIIGFFFTSSVTSMYLSGTWNLDDFNQSGAVYDFMKSEFTEQNKLYLNGKETKWNYLNIVLDKSEHEIIQVKLEFLNKKNETVLNNTFDLKKGKNILELNSITFSTIDIQFLDTNAQEINIKSMQLREKQPLYGLKEYLKTTIYIFFIYIILSFIVIFIYRKIKIQKNNYKPIEILQNIYMAVGNECYKISHTIPGSIKSYIRISAFLLMILFMIYFDALKKYYKTQYFKYFVFIICICLLCVAFVSINQKLKQKNWNNPLVMSWFVLWMLTCISDFIIVKSYAFVGYVMLFVMGFLFFVWNNMEGYNYEGERYNFLRDFVNAIEISYVLSIGYCLLYRPAIQGYRYMGTSYNPNIFAMYMVIACCVMLTKLDHYIINQSSVIQMVFYAIGFLVSVLFIGLTQSRTGYLAVTVVLIIILFKNIVLVKDKIIKKKFWKVIVIMSVLVLPVKLSFDWGIYNISEKWGKPIEFKHDAYKVQDVIVTAPVRLSVTTYAANKEGWDSFKDAFNRRIRYANSLEEFTSGRLIYYKRYLSSINLWGHEYLPIVRGQFGLAHNGVLAIIYKYGIFAAIPYLYMLYYTLHDSFLYMIQNSDKRLCLFPIVTCAAAIMILITENLEQAFRFPTWIALYLIMGMFFEQKLIVDK